MTTVCVCVHLISSSDLRPIPRPGDAPWRGRARQRKRKWGAWQDVQGSGLSWSLRQEVKGAEQPADQEDFWDLCWCRQKIGADSEHRGWYWEDRWPGKFSRNSTRLWHFVSVLFELHRWMRWSRKIKGGQRRQTLRSRSTFCSWLIVVTCPNSSSSAMRPTDR